MKSWDKRQYFKYNEKIYILTEDSNLSKEGMKLKSLIHGLDTIHEKTDSVLLKNIPKDLFISLVRRGLSQVIEKH